MALLDLYRDLLRIRAFEDEVSQLFGQGIVRGPTHLSHGQEAIPVGIAAVRRPDDTLTCTYRSHGWALAWGLRENVLLAEMLGRRTGSNAGRGGSMHVADPDLGLVGAYAIVGAGIPVAVGAAWSAQVLGETRVSVTSFGDGATNIGAFHEALNLAAVWRLPVVFVCENNLYGEYSPILSTTPSAELWRRGAAYGMASAPVDGNDVEAVTAAAAEAFDRARSGEGPTFLEMKTYRQGGHSRADDGAYRPAEQVAAWLERDPVRVARERLVERGELDAASDGDLQERTADELAREVRTALDARDPEESELYDHVHA